jgi:hypothetical protein
MLYQGKYGNPDPYVSQHEQLWDCEKIDQKSSSPTHFLSKNLLWKKVAKGFKKKIFLKLPKVSNHSNWRKLAQSGHTDQNADDRLKLGYTFMCTHGKLDPNNRTWSIITCHRGSEL